MTEIAHPHQSLVALTPSDMGVVQTDLAAWCAGKIRELSRDLRDARQNCRHARTNKWRWQPFDNLAKKVAKQMIYYSKIKAAVQAGFLVVPNFPAEVVAVRVERVRPTEEVGAFPSNVNDATHQPNLPAGRGRYVDETKPAEDLSYHEPDGKGGSKLVRHARSTEYDEVVDFPMTMVKPIVLEATQRAMALKIFDRIGLVNHDGTTHSRKQHQADPIVIGQIFDGSRTGWNKDAHRVTFFIAWWLDTRML